MHRGDEIGNALAPPSGQREKSPPPQTDGGQADQDDEPAVPRGQTHLEVEELRVVRVSAREAVFLARAGGLLTKQKKTRENKKKKKMGKQKPSAGARQWRVLLGV